jgi:hypothetical protein
VGAALSELQGEESMIDSLPSRVNMLLAACERDLGNPDLWFKPEGYPESLALCIIDSIYSTGARYSSVLNVAKRYRDYRLDQGGNPDTDGADELRATIDELGGPDPWATCIGNRRPTSTAKGAPLKAEAIRQIATTLPSLGIRSNADLRAAADAEELDPIKAAWQLAPGQRSGITWNYALMLARIPGVKADRMVIRYVADAIGKEQGPPAPKEASDLVKQVAELKGWDVIYLDHAIWRKQSDRPVNVEQTAGENLR